MKETLSIIGEKGCRVQHLADALKLAIDTVLNHPEDGEKMNGAVTILDFASKELGQIGEQIERICIDATRPMDQGASSGANL